ASIPAFSLSASRFCKRASASRPLAVPVCSCVPAPGCRPLTVCSCAGASDGGGEDCCAASAKGSEARTQANRPPQMNFMPKEDRCEERGLFDFAYSATPLI